MAYFDAVFFVAAASGTGDFGVASAVQGYRTPAGASVPNGAVGGYRAESSNLLEWEIGVFTYSTTGPTVARTTVLANSLGTTAKINFTTAPNVGFVELSQDLTNASLLLTGTVAPARLGSGGAGAGAKFLADNSTFQTLTNSGVVSVVAYTSTQTITIPAGATRARVVLWGGSAGGILGNICLGPGSAGCGAGALEKYLTGLTAGNTLALTVGAAGSVSGNGGNSTLASGTQTISTLTANGGTTSAPGTATGGDFNFSGQLGSVPSNTRSPGGVTGLGRGVGGQGGGFGNSPAATAGTIGGCIIEWLY